MYSKIFNSIFLISTIISLVVSINTYIAQAQSRSKCLRWICSISTNRGKYSPPIIPSDVFARSTAAVREGIATPQDYLVLGHNAFNNQQYSEAEKNYSQANELAAETQDKEVQATAQYGLGEVNSASGNQDRANSYFNQSISIFNSLEDSQSVNQVQLRQNQLRQQLQLRPEVRERIELQQRLNGH